MFIILFYFPFAKVVLIPYIHKNIGLRLVKRLMKIMFAPTYLSYNNM